MGHIPEHDMWIQYMPGKIIFFMNLPKENCGCKNNLVGDIMLLG